MNNSRNAIDYVVKKKASGGNLVLRILLFVVYIGVFLGIIIAAYSAFQYIGIIGGGVLSPIVSYIIYRLTWSLVSYDYRYQIYVPAAGMDTTPHTLFQLDKMVTDKKKQTVPKFVYKNEMRNADLIAPYTPEKKAEYTASDVKKTIDWRSAPSVTQDVYFLRFKEEDGSKTVVIVEAVNKIVDSFKHYAGDVTEVTELSR